MNEFDLNRVRRETVVDHFDGHVYVSGNGKLVIDKHASDEAHLKAPASRNVQPMYDCRTYVDDVVPKEWHGTRVEVEVTRDVVDGVVMSVQLKLAPLGKLSP